MIFTTRGYLPPEQVRMVASVTEDDASRVTRTDKYAVNDGEWIGNDLHVEIKQPLTLAGVTGQLG